MSGSPYILKASDLEQSRCHIIMPTAWELSSGIKYEILDSEITVPHRGIAFGKESFVLYDVLNIYMYYS